MDSDYFLKYYKLIAIDLSKQTESEKPDLRQQINFIRKLEINEWALSLKTFNFSQNLL